MDYFFTKTLTDICERSMVAPGRPLRCTIIVNPIAGGFTIQARWKQCIQALNACLQKAQTNPKRQIYKSVLLNITEGKDSAGKITKDIINRAEKDTIPFYLIISAGGDGTHGEIMLALYNAPDHIRSNMAILKLPMGTGNDGADATSIEEALNLLINPVNIQFVPAVQLITAGGGPSSSMGPFFAFNILSVGMDAFVTHMTNKRKPKSDSYKLWLNIACLFYGCKYKIDFFDVRAFDDKKNEVLSYRKKLLLLAMGASGHRTYGSQQKIFPDDRNVCVVKQMSVFRKLAIKGQVKNGTHMNNPEVTILSAHRLEFSGKHPILAQMDGETILLQPEDFPATMELTAPVIPLLKMG